MNPTQVAPQKSQTADAMRANYISGLTSLSGAAIGQSAGRSAPAAGPAQPVGSPTLASITSQAQREALQHHKKMADGAVVGSVVAALVMLILCWLLGHARAVTILALVIASVIVIGTLILLTALNTRKEGGVFNIIRGQDGRLSTTYAQAAIWTLLLVFAFLFFIAQMILGSLTPRAFQSIAGGLSPAYLLLLGGPFAVAAGAHANYAIRKDDGTIQKTDAYGAQLKDVISDDAGRTSLNDTQYFLFNVVTAAAFVVLLGKHPDRLPGLPDTLVGLTSIGALAFITTKTVSNQRPLISTIVSVSSSAGPPTDGDLVEIRGANFVVPGADKVEDCAQMRVRFDSIEVGIEPGLLENGSPNPTSSRVRVRVPLGLAGTQTLVTVVTPVGVETNAYPLNVG